MMYKPALQYIGSIVMGIGFLAAWPAFARAAENEMSNANTSVVRQKNPDKPQSVKVKLLPGSQESSKQRRARLKIECQGAANAGACTGYTR